MAEQLRRTKIIGVCVRSVLRSCRVLIAVCCFLASYAQDAAVTFEVKSGSVGKDDHVYITGNHALLGNWNPAITQLERADTTWRRTIQFPVGTQLEFKFTKGSWDTEAVREDGRVPGNQRHVVQGDTLLTFTVPFWKDSVYNTAPQISGDYQIHENVPVKGLDARRVIVWLPPSYTSNPDRRYPVLYLHDGQNVFDLYTSTLGYDWRIDETADSLIRRGEITEFIAVAVYCDADVRGREYSDDPDLGEKYQDFMCCQLKPWIDNTYRTLPGPEHTAVMGSSMGGLISFILAWEYPHIYSKAACLSPAFKFQRFGFDVDYVSDVRSSESPENLTLYIDNGTVDLESILQPGIDEMMKVLDEKGVKYTWFLDEGAPHTEYAWAARAWRPLKMFFGKN